MLKSYTLFFCLFDAHNYHITVFLFFLYFIMFNSLKILLLFKILLIKNNFSYKYYIDLHLLLVIFNYLTVKYRNDK